MTRGRQREPDRCLSAEELDGAIADARAAGDAHLLQRLCFVKNCYAGDTATEAARRVGVSRSTGTRWLDRWNEGGLEALGPDRGGGRPAKLAEDDRDRLRTRLEAAEPWTTDEVDALLREEFGVDYASGYLPRLLRSLGFVSAQAGSAADRGESGRRPLRWVREGGDPDDGGRSGDGDG